MTTTTAKTKDKEYEFTTIIMRGHKFKIPWDEILICHKNCEWWNGCNCRGGTYPAHNMCGDFEPKRLDYTS